MAKHETITPLEALQRQTLLAELPTALLQELLPHITFQKIDKGQVIFKKGAQAEGLVMLVAGDVQVVHLSEDGREVGIHLIHPGDFVGELSVIDDQARSATMIATSEAIVAHMPAKIAKHLFLHQPLVTDRILKRLCHTIRQSTKIRSVLSMNRAHTRIYSLLLNAAKPLSNNVIAIEDLPNQHTLATMANVSRETVSRALQVLIKQGIIQKETKRLIVKDPQKLEKMAKGELAEAA